MFISSISATRTIHMLHNVMFESSFWPHLALRMLHFQLYPIQLGILEQTLSSVRFLIANSVLNLQFSIRYLIALSKTANIVTISYILCQLLGVNQRHPL